MKGFIELIKGLLLSCSESVKGFCCSKFCCSELVRFFFCSELEFAQSWCSDLFRVGKGFTIPSG